MFRTVSPLPYNLCSPSLVQALNMEGTCQSSICHLTMTSSSCLLTLLNLCQDFMIRSVSLYSYNLASRYLLLLYVKISSNLKCSCMSMSSSIYPVFLWNFSFSWFIPSLIKKKSHLNLLLRTYWTKLNQIWLEWSLVGPFSKLWPTIPPSIQNGYCYEE
jgi:hypothetical protein